MDKNEFFSKYQNRTFACVGGNICHSVDKTDKESLESDNPNLTVEELWSWFENNCRKEQERIIRAWAHDLANIRAQFGIGSREHDNKYKDELFNELKELHLK